MSPSNTLPKKHLPLLLLILFATIELFLFLNQGVVYWDEAIYAQVAKEIVERQHWLTLHWNGHPWFHKPPLYFWSTGVLFQLFGVSEFLARATSALSGVGAVLISYTIANRIYGRPAGFLAAIILLTTPLFVTLSRFGSTDVTLTFFVLLAVYAFLCTQQDERFWLLAGTACALAIMVKGAAGLVATGTLFLAVLFQGEYRKTLSSPFLWWGAIVGILLAGAWHLLMYLAHGNEFIASYLFRHVVERSRSNLDISTHGYAYYFWVLWEFFFPWVCLIPPALILTLHRKKSLVLVILGAVVLGIFTIARTKFTWYVLPALPAFAILIGGALALMIERLRQVRRMLAYMILLLLSVAGSATTLTQLAPLERMESAARLSKMLTTENFTVCPEDLSWTVLFYSGRRLCADPVLSPLVYQEATTCSEGPQSIIFGKEQRERVESRYHVTKIAEDGDLELGLIEGVGEIQE